LGLGSQPEVQRKSAALARLKTAAGFPVVKRQFTEKYEKGRVKST
jgi:hypothetical protein